MSFTGTVNNKGQLKSEDCGPCSCFDKAKNNIADSIYIQQHLYETAMEDI